MENRIVRELETLRANLRDVELSHQTTRQRLEEMRERYINLLESFQTLQRRVTDLENNNNDIIDLSKEGVDFGIMR